MELGIYFTDGYISLQVSIKCDNAACHVWMRYAVNIMDDPLQLIFP